MTFTERRQRVTDKQRPLLFLEISTPSMPEKLRIVNDTQNWTSQGVEYIGFPFGFKLPDDVSGQASRAQLVVDNVGRSLTEDLEAISPNELMIAKLMVSDRANPDLHEKTYFLPMMRASVTPAQVTAQLGVDFMTRQQAVKLRFNPFLAPGLF